MAKISELPQLLVPSGQEIVPVVADGETKGVQLAPLLDKATEIATAAATAAQVATEYASAQLAAGMAIFRLLGPAVAVQGRASFASGPERRILLTTIRPGSAVRFIGTGAATYSLRYVPHPKTTVAPVYDVYVNGAPAGRQLSLAGAASTLCSVDVATNCDPASSYHFELRLRGLGERDPRWEAGAGPQLYDVTGGDVVAWDDLRPRDLWLGDSITGAIAGRYPGTGPYLPELDAGDVCYGRLVSEMSGRSPVINGFGGSSLAGTALGSGGVPPYWTGSRINSPAFYYKAGVPIEAERFDRIFINLGTNDNGAGVSDADFKAAMIALCLALRQYYPGAAIYIIRPFGGFKARPALEAALEAGVHWIDTFAWGLTFSDGIHPDVAGHAEAARRLYAWLTTTKVFSNGDFSDADVSMWLRGAGDGTLTVADGVGKITGFAQYCQAFTTVIGQTYRVRGTCTGADTYIQKGDDPTAQVNPVTFASRPATIDTTFVATSEYTYIVLTTFNGGSFDNLQVTPGAKLFTNGDFSDADVSMWSPTGSAGFTGGITIEDGRGYLSGQSQVAQSFTTIVGQRYRIHFDRGGTDPYVQVASVADANPDIAKWEPGSGSVTSSFVATSPVTYVVLSTFTGGWYDNISIEAI